MARVYASTSIDPTVSNDDMSKMSKLLNQLNISVRDTTGAYKPFNDILKEVATKEDGMSDSSKMALNTMAAGQRQSNIFANALSTVGTAQDLTNKGTNSANALLSANSIYLDTASAKWKVLGSTINAMWQNMTPTAMIGGMIDGLTKVINVFGNFNTILAVATTALMLFKGTAIKDAIVSVGSFIVGLTSTTIACGISATAIDGITIATRAFSAAWDANPLGIIALGITLVVGAVDLWNNASQAQIDNLGKVSSAITQEQSDIDGLQGKLKTLDDLHSKTTLTNDDKTQLKTINSDLASQYPELITYYDKESKSFSVSTQALKDLITQKEKLAMMDNANNLQSAKDASDKAKKASADAQAQLSSGKNSGYMSSGKNKNLSVGDPQTTADKQKLINTITEEDKAQATANETINQGTQLINDYTTSQLKSGVSQTAINKSLLGMGYSQDEINSALKMGTTSTDSNTNATKANSTAKATNLTTTDGTTDATNAYTKAVIANSNGIDTSKLKADDFASAITKVNDQMQLSKGIISSANTILDQHTKSNEWDMDAILKLAASYPALLSCIGNDGAMTKELGNIKDAQKNRVVQGLQVQIQANVDMVNALGKAYNADAVNKNASEEAKNQSVKDAIGKRISMYQDELEAMNEVSASPTISVDAKTGKLTVGKAEGLTDKEKSGQASATAGLEQAQADLAKLTTASTAYKQMTAVSANLGKYLTTAGDSTDNGITGSATSAADKAATAKQTKADKASAAAEKKATAAEAKAAKATQHQSDLEAKAAEKVAMDQLKLAEATTNAGKRNAQNTLSTDLAAEDALKKKGATAQQISDAKISAIQAQTQSITDATNAQTANILATQKSASNAIIAGYQSQIDAINAKSAAEQKVTDQLKFQKDLIQQAKDVTTAENEKNVKTMDAKGNWNWEANSATVQTAKDALTSTQASYKTFQTGNKIDILNALIKTEQDKQAKLTGYAVGTDDATSGVKKINENGIELVIGNEAQFKGGEKVIPAPQTASILSGESSLSSNSSTPSNISVTPVSNSTSDTSSTNDTSSNIPLSTSADTESPTSTADTSFGDTSSATSTLDNLDSPKIKEAVTKLLADIDNTIKQFVANSPNYAKNADNNIGMSIKSNDVLIKTPVSNLITDIESNIQSFVDMSPSFGKNTDANIGNGITNNKLLTIMPMNDIITQLQAGMSAFALSSIADGSGIVTNLGTGITSKNKDIVDIVTKLTKQIIDLFNSGFGIASPSKVNNIAV